MAFTYDSDALATALNHVRFLVQDTVDEGHFFEDAEIEFAITQESNIYRTAAGLCRAIAAQVAKQAGYDNDRVDFNPEEKAKQYMALAKTYDEKADRVDSSLVSDGEGGMSFPTLSVDSVDPAFTRDLHYS